MWNCSAEELLRRASSSDPTPGGGSVAALAAAFGFSLVHMAIAVTLAGPELSSGQRAALGEAQSRVARLQAEAVEAVDRDVSEFDAVMASYRMPRATDPERERRREAIDEATVTATQGPLGLAEAGIRGIRLVDEIEALIKPTIVSDAQAGRDLLRGAARAALRTADINLVALEAGGHAQAPALRARRDAVAAAADTAERA